MDTSQQSKITVLSTLPAASTKAVLSNTGTFIAPVEAATISRQQEASPAPAPPVVTPTYERVSPLAALHAKLSSTNDHLKDMKSRAFARSESLRKAAQTSPINTARRELHATGSRSQQPPPSTHQRVKQRVDTAFQNRLSEQLSVLTNTASDIRATFDSIYMRDGQPVASFACKNFTVGKAFSMTSSKVDVSPDRLEYYFHHHQHGKIHMVMRFRDVDRAEVDTRQMQFRFHVARPLHHFGLDYDHAGGQHMLAMQFTKSTEAQEFADVICKLLPHAQVRG